MATVLMIVFSISAPSTLTARLVLPVPDIKKLCSQFMLTPIVLVLLLTFRPFRSQSRMGLRANTSGSINP